MAYISDARFHHGAEKPKEAILPRFAVKRRRFGLYKMLPLMWFHLMNAVGVGRHHKKPKTPGLSLPMFF